MIPQVIFSSYWARRGMAIRALIPETLWGRGICWATMTATSAKMPPDGLLSRGPTIALARGVPVPIGKGSCS